MTATSSVSKKNTRTRRDVSDKVYNDLRNRIGTALTATGNEHLYSKAMVMIDSYLTDRTLPSANTDNLLQTIFLLLKPEIDRAIDRSARARQRAVKRTIDSRKHQATPSALSPEHCTIPILDNIELYDRDTAPEPAPLLNRRMRRLMEQERQRELRRKAKATVRNAHGHDCGRE